MTATRTRTVRLEAGRAACDSDRIITPAYGQALAAAFPQAQFTLISQAGHLPQLEQPAATFGALDAFIGKSAS